MRIKIFIWLFFVFNATNVLGQDPYHITYDVDNGLPSSEIYDIISDKNENIWISTDRGIVKCNGSSFQLFTTNNGLGDNTNFHFNIDAEDRIWCSGFNKSLSYIDTENDSIYQFEYNPALKTLLNKSSSNWIKYFEGTIDSFYFVTLNNAHNAKYYEFDNSSGLSLDNQAAFSNKEFNFQGNDTTIEIHNEYYTFYSYPKRFYRVSKALVNHENSFTILHNKNELRKLNFADSSSLSAKIPYEIQKIYLDNDDNLWVCSRRGLHYFENADLSKAPKIYFSELLISSITEDFQGNYWVGTNDSGVKFVPSFSISNADYAISEVENESFLSAKIFKEKLVFGSSKSKILICENDNRCEVVKVPIASSNSQINNIEYWEESLILSTGLLYDGTTFKNTISLNPSITEMTGFKYHLANKDIIFTSARDMFTLFASPYDRILRSSEFLNPIVLNLRTIVQNQNEDIFLGTMNGLFKVSNYDYHNNIEILDKSGKGLGRISDIIIDKNNIVWAATIGNGIYAIGDTMATKVNNEKSLTNPMVNNIAITNDSILWLATNNGIEALSYTYVDSLKVKFLRNINKGDGLISTSVNDLEFWNGEIWAATNAGVCNFSPNILDEKVPQIPIAITEFMNQDSVYNIKGELSFKPKQNDIFISYSGLSFQQFSDEVEYKYRLIKDGIESDDDWYFTNARSERFNDLKHGNYTFEVNAMNKLGIWNDSPARINFVIQPRFVDTLLFKFLMLFLLLLIAFVTIKIINYRNFVRQKRLLELEEAKRKTQEAEISAIRNQMNPHFVYNSLNSIQNLIFKNDSYGANYYLSKFSTLMRQSLQFTSVNFISLKQEFDFLENYLELEMLRFPNKFEFEFVIDDLIDPSLFLIPSLILQPIVENSIKHGFDNIDYKGILKIEALLKENLLEIYIKDNGCGTKKIAKILNPDDTLHKSFGTKMVQNRIDLLNKSHFDVQATIDISPSENGYQTKFILPIIHHNDSGTYNRG